MVMEGVRMRTFLFAASALLAVAAPANAATRNFGITSFAKIRVEGPYRVSLTTGIAPFAKASGSPAALDRVAVDVRGDTLVIHSSQSWGGFPGADPGPVEISVGTHDLTNATLFGAGLLSIDRVKGLSFALTVEGSGASEIGSVAADQMNVTLEGTASAKLGGRAGKLTALVNIGPANPREFAEVTSTSDVLAPLAVATGGDVRRLEDRTGVTLISTSHFASAPT